MNTIEVAGSGPAVARQAILAQLDAIVDPCSNAIGHPVGLASMGIIDRLDVTGTVVSVRVLPTFPGCLFQGFFEAEIEKRLLALPWCTMVRVTVCSADRQWDESRMSPAARAGLGRPAREQRVGSSSTRR
jgi:metal-sulfur cluster biosynthetic enzyme